MRGPVVTIDGPAGVGKSTVGRRVAALLGLPFIDTGVFYRALTVSAARAGLGPEDAGPLAALAGTFEVEVNTDPAAGPDEWQAKVGEARLRDELWDPANAALLAAIARQPPVRSALLELQRRPASEGAVAVGRDTGTVVFPSAVCKVYLDAEPETRIGRRRKELAGRGSQSSEEVLRQDVLVRDQTDRSRSEAPLTIPEGAREIDTDALDADQVTQLVLAECYRRGIRPKAPGPVGPTGASS